MIVAESMASAGRGCVINISSMAALRQLSGVLGYSVAKTGIDSFTRWMAVELARKFGDGLRVNAIAPGFFVTTQNRAVLMTSPYRDEVQVPVNPETMEPLPAHE